MATNITDESKGKALAFLPPPILVPEDVLRTAERLRVAEQLPQVVALSRELFGDASTLRVIEDPELADWTLIAVDTRLTGTVE